MPLSIFHVRDLWGNREIVLRAHSMADAEILVASALTIEIELARDSRQFTIVEVNYGVEFAQAGPRGVIARF